MSALRRFIVTLTLFSLLLSACGTSTTPTPTPVPPTEMPPTLVPVKPAYESGEYRNLFADYLGKSEAEIQAKIDGAFEQLFYGDENSERVYYPVGLDMAYMLDTGNDDVRSEGMSYGMMIAVQLNKKNEFDRLWKWAKTYMYQQSGGYQGYFAWHCKTDGTQLAANPASDGEVWFITALFFADARWGSGEGIYNYRAEAQAILDTALDAQGELSTNLFDLETKQVVFVPQLGVNSSFTDPSYHLPHYYELWARWADKNNDFWAEAAKVSRAYLKTAVNPQTGLAPNYSNFDGAPVDDDYNGKFRYDSFRVGANVGVDYAWFAADPWAVEQSNRLLDFFASQGIDSYTAEYTLDGQPLSSHHPAGLVGTNAAAALAADPEKGKPFVQALWDLKLPTGQYRYYDGLLAFLGMLQVSGNFRIYEPGVSPRAEILPTPLPAVDGKFSPETGRALLLIGPDAESISAYFDATVTAPGGVSVEASLKKPDIQMLDDVVSKFPKSALAIGLRLDGLADSIPAGEADQELDQLLGMLSAYQRPVYLRVGPEFDLAANQLQPESYVSAWKYIHHRIQTQGVKNVALVWQSAAACENSFGSHPLADWFPGDEFVDWVAVSYADQASVCDGKSIEAVLQLAREHFKPVMVVAAPPQPAQAAWFMPLFEFMHANADLARALVYVHAAGNLFADPDFVKAWKAETRQSFWLRGGPTLFETLGE